MQDIVFQRDALIRYGIRLAELTNLNRLDNSYPMSVLRTQTIENLITENSGIDLECNRLIHIFWCR